MVFLTFRKALSKDIKNPKKGRRKMSNKELKNLNRKQLLELLLEQTERAERLEEKLKETQRKLDDRMLTESNAGSIAEASLKLNGIFESAQNAAEQYLENIRVLSEKQEEINARREAESRKKAEDMIATAEKKCREREAESERRVAEMSQKIHQMYKQKQALDDFFKDCVVIGKDE